ncbi:alpha-L-rhamnosidase N-terminal domain-containing protein [Neiella sp. HB171785]|uniref:Alpha-L-rhamnosidase N-terminal domain-containing protein n=2 Tax=Neiella litorisoli TaxID=2771431 RepID=A0A8J6QTC9_9GAMM|nr:alpha-L-rhamnosidase N-terminal domain-containing protein [Neiella litorisoli]MBD1388687.1 alpha-L-rhamnosidase N-terminal domain-containing protein [Neiella litorisoli]
MSFKSLAVEWNAEWIWLKQRFTDANSWMAFRKEVTLNDVSSDVTAYISADTKYWLWINGELVVFEGSYTGGPSPVKPSPRVDFFPIASNKYYDQVDIGRYLKKGKNTIAALTWYYGDNGQKGTHISSNKGGFIFQADVGDRQIITDSSWKVQPHPAYDKKVIKKNPYRVAAWSIKYDAQNDMNDWSKDAWYMPGFDDSDWQPAKAGKTPPKAPYYGLYPSEIPILNNYGLANCTNYPDSKFPFIADGKTIQCKLDFNKNFTPYFDIEAQAGQQIHIKSNMRLNTIETFYTTKAGRQQFESYSWLNGRIIEYTIPKGVKVHGLKYRWTGVGSTPGHFESDDPWMTRIWQMAENTLYICARDNFMDTPDRERGLWIGDVADQASYLFYSMDKPGRDLLKKAIKVTLAFSDSESGIFAGLGPGRFRELPAQSLQFIEQAIWHYYYNTGDLDTLAFAYPYVHKYLELWGMKDNGLATKRNGAWNWTDWGPQDTIDYDAIQNALYYSALVSARKMAQALDDETHMAFYDERIKSIKKAYQRHYWQDGYFSSNSAKFKDDRANAIAILFGLAEPEQYQQIVDNVLVPNHFASPHFEWMVYNAMAIAGRYDDALARMKARYGAQVDNIERSTLTEYMTGKGTENHAWNAPSTVLSQYIAGIEPTAVAWQTYQVMPNMAHMKRVQQKVPSVQGDIDFEISRSDDRMQIELTSPSGTVATVGIPKAYFKLNSVAFNGKVAWQQDKPARSTDGVEFVGEDDKYLKFTLSPGVWSIVAK